MRTSIFLILVAFTLSLFGQGNTIDWRDGRPGVRVVTNSLQTGEIMGLIDAAGQAKAGTGDVARIEGELVTHTDDAAIHLTSNQVVRIAQEHGGGITNEQDLAALAADRFLPIDAGKNVISTDAGSGSIVTYSALIGDRAGNSITGANVIAIGRDAARKAILSTGEEEADIIAIGENAAEEAGQLYAVSNAIAIGDSAFKGASGVKAIAIGDDAGFGANMQRGIAVGDGAGYGAALVNSTVIGPAAGSQSSLTNSVAIGASAGEKATGAGMLFIDSSGYGAVDHPEYAMIYGSGVNLTLGKGDFWPYSTNVLRGNWLFNNNRILTNETDEAALAALAAYAAYWPPNATASSWFTFTTNNGAITITGYNIAGGTDVVIPDYINGLPVTEIGANAFMESGVTSIRGAGNVVTVGNYAFYYCSSLASVTLPQAQTVGDYAFNYCQSLTSASLPQVQTVGDGAFYYCSSLTSVSVPQVQTVGDYAFADCDSLASVSLPQVQTVGYIAFYYCTSLTSVYFDNDAPTIGDLVFGEINPNQVTIYVTNPQATGWGATFGGMPVVRLPLYADAITLNGDTITEWPSGGGSVPYTDWTGTVTPVGGTATVTIAHGNMPVLVTTAPCVLTLDPTGYGTAGVSRVSLSYYTGGNSFTFATNVISYAETPTVDTNGWNTLLIRRVSNGEWKGVGL